MIAAVYVSHNEGIEILVITGEGFDSETALIDLYEVDALACAFSSPADVEDWINAQLEESVTSRDAVEWRDVPGGRIGSVTL